MICYILYIILTNIVIERDRNSQAALDFQCLFMQADYNYDANNMMLFTNSQTSGCGKLAKSLYPIAESTFTCEYTDDTQLCGPITNTTCINGINDERIYYCNNALRVGSSDRVVLDCNGLETVLNDVYMFAYNHPEIANAYQVNVLDINSIYNLCPNYVQCLLDSTDNTQSYPWGNQHYVCNSDDKECQTAQSLVCFL